MDMLFAGILLWSAVHYIPSLMPALKGTMVEKLGNGYRGVFALLIVGSIVLMVFGWQRAVPTPIYDPLPDAVQITSVLMIISFYLLGAAHGPSNIKRYIRHPMLTGVIVWGIAHLIANGDSRSLLLFGGMIIWAVVEILAINKRDGAYQAPGPVPMKKDIIKIVAALVLYTVIVFLHPYFTGVPVMAS
ncbi:MAG: NnrU family protein [Kordiimonadaceae bacterium]|nr:NnrU family protein [Kordiimonadaceae bacterium]